MVSRRVHDEITVDPHHGFERAGRRSRPRTKDRPTYDMAQDGWVVAVDRGRYRCRIEEHDQIVTAVKARPLGRKAVIVGDRVRLVGDTSGVDGSLARIVEVGDRDTVLRRTADDDDPYERPVVANADQLVIVAALADPPPRVGMIDRILVAAYDAGLDPLLVLTKSDLAAPDGLMATYRPLGVNVVAVEPGSNLDELRAALTGRMSVLVGHSGVGKSTLVNALIPGVDRATGEVNDVTGRGRHTSTSAIALELPSPGGWVIDTPGVRSFGLSHVTPDSFIATFSDLAELIVDCPRGCRHDTTAVDCGLDAAVAAGRLSTERLESFRRMERAFG
ncbi:MAG: ribosome small subunit-dependent GTPase A [Actinobacteria bacterium HGW-Actinobacteria-2]|nr:MAG: ribosome small subunit-dependent GTPase A [Actinobacteria bacterium HGW-Actinobacteria-2]